MRYVEYLVRYDRDYNYTVHYSDADTRQTVKTPSVKLVNTGNGFEFSWGDKTTFLDYYQAAEFANALHIMNIESPNPANARPDDFFKLVCSR